MPRTDYWNSPNPDIRNSMAGMRRAAKLARDIAIQTDTAIIIVRDGKTVRVTAAELRQEREAERVRAESAEDRRDGES